MKKLEIFLGIPDFCRTFASRDFPDSPPSADCADVSLGGLAWPAMETFLGVTGAPGRTRCKPLTTILSPSCKPSRPTRHPSVIGPRFTGRHLDVLFFRVHNTFFCFQVWLHA